MGACPACPERRRSKAKLAISQILLHPSLSLLLTRSNRLWRISLCLAQIRHYIEVQSTGRKCDGKGESLRFLFRIIREMIVIYLQDLFLFP